MENVVEFLLPYIPYLIISFNAIVSCMTYKKTGKATKINPQTKEQVIDEDLQALINYHEQTAKALRDKVVK